MGDQTHVLSAYLLVPLYDVDLHGNLFPNDDGGFVVQPDDGGFSFRYLLPDADAGTFVLERLLGGGDPLRPEDLEAWAKLTPSIVRRT